MEEPPVLVAHAVSKNFGQTVALRDVTLSVPAGCVFGFIGPNGSGKTTFIRAALNLLHPTGGRIELLGRDSQRSGTEARRRVSYLPGNLALPPKLTGLQFLSDVASLQKCSDHGTVHDLADTLNADLDRPMGDLSLGNRRKIGLIAALAHEPRLIFLDEPTSGMDPLVQQSFRTLVRRAAARGATVFLSSHVLDEVQHVSHLVGVIREGSIVTSGTIEDLTRQLTRRFTADFEQPIRPSEFGTIPNVVDVQVGDRPTEIEFSVRGASGPLFTALQRHAPLDVRGAEPDLEDVFIDLYRGGST